MNKMNRINSQKGFTLIELVIVIVILGILAATAAPKFVDLQGDAKASTRTGVVGSVKAALNLGYAKGAVNGLANAASGTQLINGKHISFINGYPSMNALGTGLGNDAANAANLLHLLDLDSSMLGSQTSATKGVTEITIEIASDCTVTIEDVDNANLGDAPTIGGTTTCA